MSLSSLPFWEKNIQALAASGQDLTRRWLEQARLRPPVDTVAGPIGHRVLVVDGQSQASRHDPQKEARQWLERIRGQAPVGLLARPLLFGFGNPWVANILLEIGPLTVFEPDARVLKAIFGLNDYSSALTQTGPGQLTVICPWHLAEGLLEPGLELLVHPPTARRAAAQLANLQYLLSGRERGLAGSSGRRLKIMLIPPLSGGSAPVAVSLARAVEAEGHLLFYLDWDGRYREMEKAAHRAPAPEAARLTAKLFEETGPRAAAAAAEFQPDLVLALAQAPLDAPGLARLREKTGAAPLAFWLVEDLTLFKYVAEVAPAYDLLFHIQPGPAEEILRDWGLGRTEYLPLAADPDLFRPLPGAGDGVFAAKLSFMGAGYPNRRRLLTRLAETYWPKTGRPEDQFKVFGSGWAGVGQSLRRHLFEGGRRVSQPECALIYAGGLVNLNIHSSGRPEPEFDSSSRFVNPRTFEIAAAGALQIVDARPLMPALFEVGRELIEVATPEELPDLIDHYLNHPEEAAEIGRRGRERVLAEHTYRHRLNHILRRLGWRMEN